MGRLNGVEPSMLKRRIPEALDQVGLTASDKPVRNYSKGMQQRLGLAQALINDPELLFLDEPTDGLDPLGRIEVRDLLLRLRDAGKTIFINSHLLSEVESVCDRILILNKGTVACTTTPAEFARGTGDYIVRVQQLDAAAMASAQAVIEAVVCENDTLRFSPKDLDQLNGLLDALRKAGAVIVSVEPQRISLEQFFIRVVQEKGS
jgi:ABC-2 type transport system ATP-binding protein